ncbi:MAG: preprotein translocase subunit YajC [Treponema sp.]|nr:preprotein translocase subunit YajC [Treponema sp.]MCL2251924.1 preprotein translocase subunit YajC [Treponema sp.]
MYSFVLPLLMAAPPEGAEVGAGSIFSSLIPFAAIILIFYFLIIRPQNKKRKETEKMLGALKKGDKIVTIGGVYGTIQSVKESTVIVKVDENVKLEFLRSAISTVVSSKEEKITDNSESEKENSESGE